MCTQKLSEDEGDWERQVDIGATGTVFLGSLSVPDGSALDEIFGFAVYGKDILTQKCYDEAITGRES